MLFFKTKKRIRGTTEHSRLPEHEGQEDWYNKPEKNPSLDAGRALAFLNSDFSKAFHMVSYPLSSYPLSSDHKVCLKNGQTSGFKEHW